MGSQESDTSNDFPFPSYNRYMDESTSACRQVSEAVRAEKDMKGWEGQANVPICQHGGRKGVLPALKAKAGEWILGSPDE